MAAQLLLLKKIKFTKKTTSGTERERERTETPRAGIVSSALSFFRASSATALVKGAALPSGAGYDVAAATAEDTERGCWRGSGRVTRVGPGHASETLFCDRRPEMEKVSAHGTPLTDWSSRWGLKTAFPRDMENFPFSTNSRVKKNIHAPHDVSTRRARSSARRSTLGHLLFSWVFY